MNPETRTAAIPADAWLLYATAVVTVTAAAGAAIVLGPGDDLLAWGLMAIGAGSWYAGSRRTRETA